MGSLFGLIYIALIFFATRFVLTAVGKWLATEKSAVVRNVSNAMWALALIAVFTFLFDKRGLAVATISTFWHYLLVYADKNKLPDDKDS
jgi:hypothetical protein